MTDELGETTNLLGKLEVPQDIEITFTQGYDTYALVPDNFGAVTLWETGMGALDTFNFLYLETDATVFLEFETSDGEFLLIEVTPNAPLMLRSDSMGADETATRLIGSEITAFSDVVAIAVQRNVAESAGDATVRMILLG